MPVCFHLQAADGLAAAVQTAAEEMEGIDADGRPQLVVQIDVIGQPEPLAGVAEAVFIDLRLQGSQLFSIGDLIRIAIAAITVPDLIPLGVEGDVFRYLDGPSSGILTTIASCVCVPRRCFDSAVFVFEAESFIVCSQYGVLHCLKSAGR